MPRMPMPAVSYASTAARPSWADLPGDLRTAISARLGSQVTWATTAGGGFTRGFAAVVDTADGQRVFVKAASLSTQRHLTDWYAREVAVTAALPAAVPAARPKWTLTAAGHYVICLEAIEGRMPGLPWQPAELDAALAAWAVAAEALREPPAELVAVGMPTLSELIRHDLSWWREIATGREAMPPVPPWVEKQLDELVALEAALPELVRTGSATHCDLRLDNVLIDGSGAAWLCDWNWICFGPAWFDTVSLLMTAYASDLDADALFAEHPTARDAPPDGLDAALAALGGYLLTRAEAGPTSASPHLVGHQRWTGEVALAWLASRRGWA
ncbi:phosphotransferase family protein [Phytohabitans kaempferiae]|uniref:Phosphotransferase family protein n=1 Tax=Phytohabitans kaempferiae TaxID=1620943 RepID=A0ABV6MD21_9ACTN